MKRFWLLLLVMVALGACDLSNDTAASGQQQNSSPPPITVLGSTLSAFEARFGQAEHDQDWTTGKDLPNDYVLSPDLFGPNYTLHVISGRVSDIFILGLKKSDQDKHYCYSFRPGDAQLVVSHPNGDENDIYLSESLAQEFPASLFVDVGDTRAGQDPGPATPGTFSVDFSTGVTESAGCHIYLGR